MLLTVPGCLNKVSTVKLPFQALLSVLTLFGGIAEASFHNHQHAAAHHLHHLHTRQNHTASNGTATAGGDAQSIVSRAQAALKDINDRRLHNPNPVLFHRPDEGESEGLSQPAPPLEVGNSGNVTSPQRRYLQSTKRSSNDTHGGGGGNDDSTAYTIPPELAEAAKVVANSKTTEGAGASLTKANNLRLKYQGKQNDTITPKQAMKVEYGLWHYAEFDGESDGGVAGLKPGGMAANTSSQSPQRRQDEAQLPFWKETMENHGKAPFAPDGYRVFRNVRDYGAKGMSNTAASTGTAPEI